MLEKSGQLLSSEQPCEPKSLDVVLNIAGVEKNILMVAVNRGDLIRVLNERSASHGENFCFLWLVIIKSV